jgi:hypothetical protein
MDITEQQATWQRFTKVATYSGVFVAVVLLLMATFLI